MYTVVRRKPLIFTVRADFGGEVYIPRSCWTMADDDVLFEDVYELCEVIGK